MEFKKNPNTAGKTEKAGGMDDLDQEITFWAYLVQGIMKAFHEGNRGG